jgi:hypothetical protein
MSSEVVALIVGTLLAVGALAFVLYPLFFGAPDGSSTPAGAAASEDSPIVALREIEFDRVTGKLSDADYAELRRQYGEQALRQLRGADSPAADPIEARVRAYRLSHAECPTCGLRPEPDAVYCSTCGTYLPRVCPTCRAPIAETSATFCSACGTALSRAGAMSS